MCYDIKASLETQLKRAKRRGDLQAVEEIMEKLLPWTDLPIHHTSGFSHPRLFIYTDEHPDQPTVSIWGLVPHWVRDRQQMNKLWNQTLNARGETIFEKPSFRDAARYHRCLVYVDGFYEHQHHKGKTYPYYISREDGEPLIMAGLWSLWEDPENGELINSFSLVTTRGNNLLTEIHNNPKIAGPRMPVILQADQADQWLRPVDDPLDQKLLQELIQPYPDKGLKAHTVRRLRGKDYPGNIAGIDREFSYPELTQGGLFDV